MAAKTFRLDIVSAKEKLFSGLVEHCTCTGELGEMGIYPHHTPLLSPIKPGFVSYKTSEGEDVIYIHGGVLEVQPDVVTILADTAIRAVDLDEAVALEAKEKAMATLRGKPSKIDFDRASAELVGALAQINAIMHLRKKTKY